MTSREDVQERIRRAQLAILNPTVEHATFLNADMNAQYPSSRSFSQNCVIVFLEGRDLSDLNFVDLPGALFCKKLNVPTSAKAPTFSGLIANVADDRNVGDIDLVQELVTSYISRPSCLILLTISCESKWSSPYEV